MFGHLPEIIILLAVGLLVFGPKRMIQMGSQFGKAFRDFREATKELSWSNLLSTEPQEQQSTLSKLSQVSQTISNNLAPSAAPATTPTEPATTEVVDSTVSTSATPATTAEEQATS